jgi:hypothetical protein
MTKAALAPFASILGPPLFALYVGIAAAQSAPRTSYTESVELAGEAQRVDVYRPDAESPLGVVIVAHGFTRSRVRHRDLGREETVTTVLELLGPAAGIPADIRTIDPPDATQ